MEAQRKTDEEANRRATELAYWGSIKNSSDPDLLQTYLDRYPEGAFSGIARIMIVRAQKRQQEAKQPPSHNKQVAAVDPDTVAAPELEVMDEADLPLKLQAALDKAGCNPGKLDGEWGRNSTAALNRFARHAKLTLPDEAVSAETLKLLEGLDGRVCPLVCNRRQINRNGQCVTKTCPAGQVLTNSGTCTRKVRRARTKTVVKEKNKATAPGGFYRTCAVASQCSIRSDKKYLKKY